MSFVNCLRLARQSAFHHLPTAPTTSHLVPSCVRLSQGPVRLSSLNSVRRYASDAYDPASWRSRIADTPKGEEHSPYKKRRLELLAEDAESDEPVFSDLYPRIKTSSSGMSIAEFLDRFEELGRDTTPVTLYGRITRIHVVGSGLIFIDLVNEFRKIQVMLNRKTCFPEKQHGTRKFQLFKQMVQVGDQISVKGIATVTSTGARTLDAMQLPELLSPAMEPIPETLTDPRTRGQERHLDMIVNKESVDILRLRSEIIKHMRDYFHSKEFLEFQTPILSENAGGAVARPFTTEATEFKGKNMALRVAPELWLKRLVIGGVEKVFEIGPAFRNESVDATHNPEFTMCEFYSAYTSLADLMKETESLIRSLAQHSHALISKSLTSLPPIDLDRFAGPFRTVEFVPALEEAMGIRLPRLTGEDALPELLAVLKLSRIHVPGDTPTSLAKLLDRLAAIYLEPMSMEEPIFLVNQPACMSPLAKSFVCPTTFQLVSARAELFVAGRELANMYEEENDPIEQKRKLERHRSLTNLSDGSIGLVTSKNGDPPAWEQDPNDEAPPLDQSFVKALDYGLPPTGGWGCGVERLVMLFSGAKRISDCLSFGSLRNVVSVSSAEE